MAHQPAEPRRRRLWLWIAAGSARSRTQHHCRNRAARRRIHLDYMIGVNVAGTLFESAPSCVFNILVERVPAG